MAFCLWRWHNTLFGGPWAACEGALPRRRRRGATNSTSTGHIYRKKKTRRGVKKKPSIVIELLLHRATVQSIRQKTIATLLSVHRGGRCRLRLAGLFKDACGPQLLLQGRRSGLLLGGLRIAAPPVATLPVARRLRRRPLCRLRRQSPVRSRSSCHRRRRWLPPRRRIGSGGSAGIRQRRRRCIRGGRGNV